MSTKESIDDELKKYFTPPRDDNGSGVTPPGAGTITGRVWGICDELATPERGGWNRVRLKDVMRVAFCDQKIEPNTVSTQYGFWKKYHKHG